MLLRVDFDMEVENGKIRDDFRLQKSLPTFKELLKQGAGITVVAHYGRPKGEVVPKFSLRSAAQALAEKLQLKFVESDSQLPDYNVPHVVFFTGDIKQSANRQLLSKASSKDIIVLENIRYYAEEETNDAEFARCLSELGNIFVNESFAVCHRKSASVVAITKFLPSFAGLQLEKEIVSLTRLLQNPKQPLTAMMGGIKISDKVETIQNLAKYAKHILLGGGLANMIFLSRGYEVGLSVVEKTAEKTAFELDHALKGKLVLPVDVVVAQKDMSRESVRCCAPFQVKKDELIFDIGPKSILQYARILESSKTIVWNGPLGFFEHKPFHHGTMSLAKVVGGVSQGDCFGVAGGGETVDAVRRAGQEEFLDHLSTGGGAMLELLAGRTLPALEALEKHE